MRRTFTCTFAGRLTGLLAVLMAAAIVLPTSGCERALFAYLNRGTPPPAARIKFAPDRDLFLDVYRPAKAEQGAPTVVFFYGGAWRRGQRSQYAFVGRRLAEAGVLAVVADYRTWPRTTFPGFMRDAADAVAWTRKYAAAHGGEPARIFVMGHSAGAQIAGLLGADRRYLEPAGMQPADLAGVIGLSGPYDFEVGQEYAPIFGPSAQWPKAQAINFVDGDEPPFLLIHGDADKVVEARDSVELDAKLKAHGIHSSLLLLPGAGHTAPLAGLYRDTRSPAVMPAILSFLNQPVR